MIDLTFLIGCDSVSAQWRVIEPSSGALRSSCLAQNCLLKRVGVTRVVRPLACGRVESEGDGEERRGACGGEGACHPLTQGISTPCSTCSLSRVFVREFQFYKKNYLLL